MEDGKSRMENAGGVRGAFGIVGKAALVAAIVVTLLLIISTGVCPVP